MSGNVVIFRSTASRTDQTTLSQCLSCHQHHLGRAWFHHSMGGQTDTMSQSHHSKRFEQQYYLRLGRCANCLRWCRGQHVDLDPCYFDASANMLECGAWSSFLLVCAAYWMGRDSHSYDMRTHAVWCQFPFRRLVSSPHPLTYQLLILTLASCHVNHQNSLATLWGPLLVLSGVSLITQLSTFGYCLRVYLKHAFNVRNEAISTRSQISSSSQSSSRAVYRRVRRVVALQWRGIAIASIVLIDTIYFSIVFVVLDGQNAEAIKNPAKFMPWLACLVYKGKEQCLGLAKPLGMNEGVLIATLIVLSISGIEAFVLLYRWEMVTSWVAYIRGRRERREFVSLDAHRFSLGPLDPRMKDTPQLGTTSTAAWSPATPVYNQPKGAVTFVSSIPNSEKSEKFQQAQSAQARAPNFSSVNPHSYSNTNPFLHNEQNRRNITRHEMGRSWLNEDNSSVGEV